MDIKNPLLPLGYSEVPAGKLATVVTCLEMRDRPVSRAVEGSAATLSVEHWPSPDLDDYRALFRAVGEDWMWVSRLEMSDEKLVAIIHDPLVEIYVLTNGNARLGLLELDFREARECELTFFGLVKDAIGQGAGRLLMNHAMEAVWSVRPERQIGRFWVHTCHFDSPAALSFYQRSGFTPYKTMVEVCDDPRLSGLMPRTAAPHVPLIEP